MIVCSSVCVCVTDPEQNFVESASAQSPPNTTDNIALFLFDSHNLSNYKDNK